MNKGHRMKISSIRISNFQSFGQEPTEIKLENEITYILGPNGSGKTVVLQALARLFSPIASQRTIHLSDFHRPLDSLDWDEQKWLESEPEFWIEAVLSMEKPDHQTSDDPSIPPFFKHMCIENDDPNAVPTVRVRLTAQIASDGIIDDRVEYIKVENEDGSLKTITMPRTDRSQIEVYYLPARRNPNEQISYTTTSLIGRLLRATDWTSERSSIGKLFSDLTDELSQNKVVDSIGKDIKSSWSELHKGQFFTNPSITIGHSEIENVLRQLNLSFSPSHTGATLSLERLSDGQKSLLYFSIVLAWQSLTQKAIHQELKELDVEMLSPPVLTIIAVEEPENSLAPYYLGRISKQLRKACESNNTQSIIATHAATMLKRVVEPELIRFLRLSEERETSVRTIKLPESKQTKDVVKDAKYLKEAAETAKYVKEAVKAYPELYFSRLVVLGEGDSEMLVLPRILAAKGIAEDDMSISVVPLGGRHVNHFWRLLDDLEIPFVTLLDLDYGRNHGGYELVKNTYKQLDKIGKLTSSSKNLEECLAEIDEYCDKEASNTVSDDDLARLGEFDVFFSTPIDLDMMMMHSFPEAYEVKDSERVEPTPSIIKSVLGKSAEDTKQLEGEITKLFDAYHSRFKTKSKPATHIQALSRLNDEELLEKLPEPLERLVERIEEKLQDLPEQ